MQRQKIVKEKEKTLSGGLLGDDLLDFDDGLTDIEQMNPTEINEKNAIQYESNVIKEINRISDALEEFSSYQLLYGGFTEEQEKDFLVFMNEFLPAKEGIDEFVDVLKETFDLIEEMKTQKGNIFINEIKQKNIRKFIEAFLGVGEDGKIKIELDKIAEIKGAIENLSKTRKIVNGLLDKIKKEHKFTDEEYRNLIVQLTTYLNNLKSIVNGIQIEKISSGTGSLEAYLEELNKYFNIIPEGVDINSYKFDTDKIGYIDNNTGEFFAFLPSIWGWYAVQGYVSDLNKTGKRLIESIGNFRAYNISNQKNGLHIFDRGTICGGSLGSFLTEVKDNIRFLEALGMMKAIILDGQINPSVYLHPNFYQSLVSGYNTGVTGVGDLASTADLQNDEGYDFINKVGNNPFVKYIQKTTTILGYLQRYEQLFGRTPFIEESDDEENNE